jgi:hypothetical protein
MLTGSVGRGGNNSPQDVRTVQSLLNKNRPAPLRPIVEDGQVGNETIAAIEEFQRRVAKLGNPDGRVDPNGATWRALTGAADAVAGRPVGPVTVVFQHHGNQPTGVIGLAGADVKSTATRYESTVMVSGGLSGNFKGSIYPDNMNIKGRIKDGDYDIYLGFHKPGTPKAEDLVVRINGFRAVLVVNANRPVPVLSNLPSKQTSDGIHIHNGYNTWTPAIPMSEGCLILAPADWPAFIKLFLHAFPNLADWTAGGGRVGKQIGKVSVRT